MPNYASETDVRTALGKLGNRLPATIDVATFLSMAHADLADRLAQLYPAGVPAFADEAAQVVRWAEAKLAAAEILDVLAELVGDRGAAAAAMRAGVKASLDGGVVGHPLGASAGDESLAGGVPVSSHPRVSSYTSSSAFPDPYATVRGSMAEDGSAVPEERARPWSSPSWRL